MEVVPVKVPQSEVLSLPEELLRATGAVPGDEVAVESTGELLTIRRAPPVTDVSHFVARLQALSRELLAGMPASVDDLISERRAEAARA